MEPQQRIPFSGKKSPIARCDRAYTSCCPGKTRYRETCGLNIDIRRFQGILFDKRATRLNGIAHQGGEQLIGSDGILTVTRSMRRLSGSMVVSHS